MSVLLIDADGELWYTRQEELGVDCIKMPYAYNDETYYYDLGKNTDFRRFYDAVRGGTVPTTMALNPQEYVEILEPYFQKGEDVLYVSFSHAMSGTFDHLQTALKQLKEKYPQRKCTVFDTKSISLGAGIQMEYAAQLKNSGATDEEIISALEKFTDRVAVYFVVDDLNHLKRGGRLSGFAAFAGTLLQIKPILSMDAKGGLSVLQKVTGKKQALRTIADKVAAELTGTEYSVYIVDADDPSEGDALANLIKEKRPEAKIVRQAVGPVIGAHCGPGTIGVIFIADKRPIPLEKDNG
ncbi:MAG TPA: DegV family protein [Candidatus Fimimonas merdipullorum]|uniref:DegV family protein n=1 Tax=Candidatus Fimimonas merdipullorum TaxID=2840822 RepID=A0A9D1SQI3_9BACT|nr:DegV family protein [Candidatus Fimimonas merdipullorum]